MTDESSTPRPCAQGTLRANHARGPVHALLVWVLAIGILGMHGLATHDSTEAAPSPTMPIAGQASSHEMQLVGTTASQPESGGSASTDTSAASGSTHHTPGAAMWCALVLIAAALTLALVMSVRVVLWLLPDAFQPVWPTRLVPLARCATGPPHEWEFSVARC